MEVFSNTWVHPAGIAKKKSKILNLPKLVADIAVSKSAEVTSKNEH